MKFLIFFAFFCATPSFAQLRPGQFGTNTIYYNPLRPGVFGENSFSTREKTDLIEDMPQYYSYINWSKGELVTEYRLPLTYSSANIGMNVSISSSRLKEELLIHASRALNQVKVSSFLTIKDIFERDEAIRNNLMASLYGLSVNDAIIEKSQIKGSISFKLYGRNSISEPFYQNIKSSVVTNYLTNTPLEISYDTIIIDLVMFKSFRPSLSTRIINQQGDLVHGIETLAPGVNKKQSAVHYVSSITAALNHPIKGKRVAYILPAEVNGASLSDIVLFDEDLRRIFSTQRSLDALRQGNVIVIHSQGL
ncbi:MAG: hypothetical protein ACRC9L_09145 [Brevinema sp.]